MAGISAFQVGKNNKRTNANRCFLDTPIVQYARIVRVIDAQTVVAEAIVRSSLSRNIYTVTLLSFSSALMEVNVYPRVGETVIVFFVQQFDPRMFYQKDVESFEAAGYNQSSGVGILVSTLKHAAVTVASHYTDGGKPMLDVNSKAEIFAKFLDSMAVEFCRAAYDSDDEKAVSMLLRQGRPFLQAFLDKVKREHGFWKDGGGDLIKLDAAVDERYSRYAPITKNIQGTQDITIGIDDNGDATPAAVTYTLGEDADIAVSSGSGRSEVFEKDVVLESGDVITIRTRDKKIDIKNQSQSLGAVLSDFIQAVHDAITLGSSTSQEMNPATKLALQALKNRCESLLEV